MRDQTLCAQEDGSAARCQGKGVRFRTAARRLLLWSGRIALAAGVGVAVASCSGTRRQPVASVAAQPPVQWEVAAGAIPSGDAAGVERAVRGVDWKSVQPPLASVSISTARFQGAWGMLAGELTRPPFPGGPHASAPTVILVRKQGNEWMAAALGDGQFCQFLSGAPQSLVGDGAKHYFIGC